MATSNVGQLYQEISGAEYYAVFMVNTTTSAYPERPQQVPVGESVSLLAATVLTDVTGTPIGTASNPLHSNTSVTLGNVSVSTNAFASGVTQTFANGTSNPLQADLNGNLKVTLASGYVTLSPDSLSLSPGSNTIGSVGQSGSWTVNLANGTTVNAVISNSLTITNTTFASTQSGTWNVGITNAVSLAANTSVNSYTATAEVQVNPLVNTTVYTSNSVVGGKLSFANAVRSPNSGVLQTVSVVSKSVQTAGYKFYLFRDNPTASTFTDHTSPSIASADVSKLVGVYTLGNPDSTLGATINTLDNVGQAFVTNGTTVYGVLVTTGTPTYTSNSDVFVTISVLED